MVDIDRGIFLSVGLEDDVNVIELETDVVIPVSVQIGYSIYDKNYIEAIGCQVNEDQDVSFMLYEEDY